MAEVYKDAYVEAARIVGRSSELTDLGRDVHNRVRREALSHRNTGQYIDSIKVETVVGDAGVEDRVVYSDDPGAAAIEWGHFVARLGKTVGRLAASRARVPGQYVFTRAFAKMRGLG